VRQDNHGLEFTKLLPLRWPTERRLDHRCRESENLSRRKRIPVGSSSRTKHQFQPSCGLFSFSPQYVQLDQFLTFDFFGGFHRFNFSHSWSPSTMRRDYFIIMVLSRGHRKNIQSSVCDSHQPGIEWKGQVKPRFEVRLLCVPRHLVYEFRLDEACTFP
jgi:hypothetical protein